MNILDSLDQSTDFHIDVIVILGKKIGVMRDYTSIVKDMAS